VIVELGSEKGILSVPLAWAVRPLGTDVPGLSNPTEGTVFPENADQRLNLTLNWFIQP
jgi:hypothetical protein